MATHSSILAWEIPWTEESGGLQSMGWQRVGHKLATKQAASEEPVLSFSYYKRAGEHQLRRHQWFSGKDIQELNGHRKGKLRYLA